MATKFNPLKDEEIVRVLKAEATQASGGAFGETEIDTQLSIERGIIWLIHAIEFYFTPHELHEVAADAAETMSLQVTRETQTAMLDYDQADLLCKHEVSIQRSAAIGTDAGPLWTFHETPKVFNYVPPLPYAAQNIYFGIISTSSSILENAFLRVRYTVRSVSDKYFFRVAQALLG